MYSRERRLQRTERLSIRNPGITRELITFVKQVFFRVIEAGSVPLPFFGKTLKSARFAIIIKSNFLLKSYQFQIIS